MRAGERTDTAASWDAIAWRRWLHQNPELSHQEHRTAEFVEGVLRGIGFTDVFRPAPTSVVATLGDTSRSVVLRADLDALPIQEVDDGRQYRSLTPNIMHACGHDVHTSIVLDTARRLFRSPPTGDRGLLFVFQQAEEVHPSGARAVLHDFRRRGIVLTSAFGIHVWPELRTGQIGLTTGPVFGGVDGVRVLLQDCVTRIEHGTAAEANAADLVDSLTRLLVSLKPLLRSRTLTHESAATLQFGSIRAGDKPNSSPRELELRGALRWAYVAARDAALAQLKLAVDDACQQTGVTTFAIELIEDIRRAVVNDPQMVATVRNSAQGVASVVEPYPPQPVGVSDDFGDYAHTCPSAYVLLGCTAPGTAPIALHSQCFDVDEEVLELGASLMERTLRTATKACHSM